MSETPLLSFRPGVGDIVVDLDTLVRSRLLIQASSGGGKSRALRYLLEQTHGRVQHLVIDPEGEFASLRERFDYVLAGKDGDVPAEPRSAKLLCRRLMELGASAVIDLYGLPLPERRRFVRLFLEELLHLPRTLWRPALVAIDEAHLFAPEKGSAESSEAVIGLVSQGRKRGYCAVLATQRLSKLHKDAAEVANRMIGRTGLDVDVKRAGDELGFDRAGRLTLPRLDPGSFYVYGPAITPAVTVVRTGGVLTTHPEPGEIAPPAPAAPAAVRAMLGELRDLPQQAAEEARTVTELQRQVTELRAQLRRAEAARGAPAAPAAPSHAALAEAARKAGERATRETARAYQQIVRGRVERSRVALAILSGDATTLGEHIGRVREQLGEVLNALGDVDAGTAPVPIPNVVPAPAPRAPAVVPAAPARAGSSAPSSGSATVRDAIGGTPARMIDALALLKQLGRAEATRANVAGLLGISWDTGTFRNNLSTLRTAGLVEDRPEGRLALTPAGEAAATPLDVPSRAHLHALWKSKVGGTAARMLDVIIAAHPRPVSRATIAETLGIAWDTGTFRNNLSELRSPGLIRDASKTEVVATDLLFPEGLS